MTIFFTADTHFGDHRAINISRRPFASTAIGMNAWRAPHNSLHWPK